ncbi:Hypothetical protein PHPALM_37899 [Phytophthora palmivora]|uniref:Uncharacterized protein n=1 Tax=Phytophthora palmivora TaxID=4796 RepID=A0A2P4WW90_9STRA|nr:Hypothetical protein PHPALM_37899 [Phytophthora palmivora]
MESSSDLLPPPGAIGTINNYSNLQLYQGTQCQLTARLSLLSWEGAEYSLSETPPREEAAFTQMAKRRGSRNYREEEVQWLFELVNSHAS